MSYAAQEFELHLGNFTELSTLFKCFDVQCEVMRVGNLRNAIENYFGIPGNFYGPLGKY